MSMDGYTLRKEATKVCQQAALNEIVKEATVRPHFRKFLEK